MWGWPSSAVSSRTAAKAPEGRPDLNPASDVVKDRLQIPARPSSEGPHSGMQLLPPLQHPHKLPNLPRPGFRLLHCLNPPQHRIPVCPVKLFKICLRPRVPILRRLKILRHSRPSRRIVRTLPTSIFLGLLNRLQPRRLHFSARNQRRSLLPINLRPQAPFRPRNKSLQPCLLVFRLLLPINPPIAKRHIQRLFVRNRPHPRILFRHPKPQPQTLAMVLLQPLSPILLGLK